MKSKSFDNVYREQCIIDIQKYCKEHGIEKDKFHFVNIFKWQDIYNKIIDNFVDKTKNYNPDLHWLNTNGTFRKDKTIQYAFDSRNQWSWILKLPKFVENRNDTAYLLIEGSSKYWVSEGNLKTIAEIIYEELFSDDYYIVDKKYRWMITCNHHECVLFVGDGLIMNEIEKLKTLYIKKYEPSYCEATAQLFYDTVHSINATDYTKRQLNAWADENINLEEWNGSLLEHYSLVAIIDDKIVGFGDIDKTGYLDRLYVHKDYQHQGIATAICNYLEWNCNTEKFTTQASITAKPFFEKRGYTVIKEQKVERKGILLTNYIMEKSGG